MKKFIELLKLILLRKWYKFLLFWIELLSEIQKQFIKPKQKFISIQEARLQLKHKNKNELVRILIKVISDKNRSLPFIKNQKAIKQYSKNRLINAILNTEIQINQGTAE